jgi:hypothetical protein
MDLLSVGTYFNYRKERKDDRITRHDVISKETKQKRTSTLSLEYISTKMILVYSTHITKGIYSFFFIFISREYLVVVSPSFFFFF